MKKSNSKLRKRTFESVAQIDVPLGRNGKHHKIVFTILGDLETLAPGNALKIAFSALDDSKENIRAALSRESKKRKTPIATAADEKYLYVWRVDSKGKSTSTPPVS